jgi:hypothetical protein
MRAVGALGLALLCSVHIVGANPLRDVAFKALEARKVLVKPSAAGLTVVGYALPPAADDAAVLPDMNNILLSADGVTILNTDVLSASEAVGRGEYDAVLVPVTFDVDGVTVGKELAGFIRLQFIAPNHVKYKEAGVVAKPVKAEPNVPTKVSLFVTAVNRL